jgi:hypothetical protein
MESLSTRPFYVISLKWETNGALVFWLAHHHGYIEELTQAGIYPEYEILSCPDLYNNGLSAIAVPCDEIEKYGKRRLVMNDEEIEKAAAIARQNMKKII